jgi:tRNA pseudouridine(38-40) synthase
LFRGLQTVQSRVRDAHNVPIPDFRSVQGILEFGLRKILRNNDITVINSSRTDAGVHAVASAVTFDVHDEGMPFDDKL